MGNDTTQQSVLFKDLFGKPVVTRFDQPDSSCDGGALLLKACDERLGLTSALAGGLSDSRQQSKVDHSFDDLLRQRVFASPVDTKTVTTRRRLSQDPVHKMLTDRDPIEGAALASQSTLSRFENAPGRNSLMRMGLTLADTVIARHRRRLRGRVKRITVELDPTGRSDPRRPAADVFSTVTTTPGAICRWRGFIQFDDEPEQYLFAYVLRPGNATAKRGAIGILRRVLERLRRAFPQAKVLVRLDGGFRRSGDV